MRRAAVGLIVVVALAIGATSASAATVTVTVGPGGQLKFSPANATINTGDTVHWTWASSFHSTTSGSPPGTPDGRWDSKVNNPPFSFDQTFTASGTFQYFCSVHYAEGMVGTINVLAPADPTAAFSVTSVSPVAGQPVVFDGSASSAPGGSISSYSWDFGDGSASGSGVAPAHAYALPGNYMVTLTVTDSFGKTASVSHPVTVGSASGDEPPSAAFSLSPPSPPAGQPVSFDASASNDPDGSIGSYSWDFGDGSSGSGPRPTHTYALAGHYVARLTVTDSDGQMSVDSQTVTIGAASPVSATASFSATPSSPVAGQRVAFDAGASSGPIVSYSWAFGDGSPGQTGVTVHHIFERHGTFAVSLTVTNGSGQTAGHTIDLEVGRPNRISRIRLRTRGHRRLLDITLSGAGVLKLSGAGVARFGLFGARHRYAVRRPQTLRIAVRPPGSVLGTLTPVGVGVMLHFRPVAGAASTARIMLRISPGAVDDGTVVAAGGVRLVRVKLPRGL